MDRASGSATAREISCRVTRPLILYVREMNGSLGNLLAGLALDEAYLTDTNNWVSHAFLQCLYGRMIEMLGDQNAVYKMALASKQHGSLGLLEWIARLLGNPGLIYSQAPRYNRFLKANGDVHIREAGDHWVLLEDRYHDGAAKTRYDCDYTRGILAGIPTIFDLPLAQVEEIECQVAAGSYGERFWPERPRQGARGCLYRVQWESGARQPLWKRLFQSYSVYRRAIDNLLEANRLIQERYAEAQRLARELEAANGLLMESQRRLEGSVAELRASEERYRLLADHVSDTIWILNLETLRFTYMNPAVERMLGFTAAEAMAMSLDQILAPESLAEVQRTLAAELAREGRPDADPGRVVAREVRQVCKDGALRWTEVNASFLRDASGRATAILGVTRDISERKRAEGLKRAKLAAEAANAAKTEFLSHMSHELRTPLNSIIGFSDLLSKEMAGPLNDEQRKQLGMINASGKHLLGLVNDVLDLERIETGHAVVSVEQFDICELAEEIRAALEPQSQAKSVSLEIDIPESRLIVCSDRSKVKQIAMNLASNAVKFTDEGDVTLACTARDGGVMFTVSDTGIGIAAEDLALVMDDFHQVDRTDGLKPSGTGLGLSISKRLVEMLGGRLEAQSVLGKGSTFRAWIPDLPEETSA